MKYHKVFFWIINIIFYLLLFWPVYGIMAYVFFSEQVRLIMAFGIIILESLLGLFCLYYIFISKPSLSKIKFKVMMIVNSVLYAIFLFSVIYIFVLPGRA